MSRFVMIPSHVLVHLIIKITQEGRDHYKICFTDEDPKVQRLSSVLKVS